MLRFRFCPASVFLSDSDTPTGRLCGDDELRRLTISVSLVTCSALFDLCSSGESDNSTISFHPVSREN